VGYTFQSYTDADRSNSREDLWNLSLAGSVEALDGLMIVAEIGTVTNCVRADKTWQSFLTGGAVYSAAKYLDLSFGVKWGLTKPEPDIALLPGLTFKFP
jgi:hypothetical protein